MYRSRRAAAEGSGVSEIVWRQIETGKRQLAPGIVIAPNPEPETKTIICSRLDWLGDGIDLLLAGQMPRVIDGRSAPREVDMEEPTLVALAAEWDELTEDDRQRVLDLARRLKGR